MDNKIQEIIHDLELTYINLDRSGLDAVLTANGPLLIGGARFTVPFSEARYRGLINRLGVMVLELSPSGQIVYSNEITSQITGIATQELLDSNCLNLIKPSNSDISIERLHREFLANVELIDYETGLVSTDGSLKVISWNTFDVFNCEHQLERIVYFGIDITEQQLAEQNLAIAAIAFDSHTAMSIYNANGDLLRVNPAYSTLTGYTVKELISPNHLWLQSDKLSDDFYVTQQKTIAETGLWSGELWSQRKHNADYQEYRTVYAVKNIAGILSNYVATHQDITERKRIENRLSIAAVAFEAAQSMFVTDAEGFFMHINSAFTKVTGYGLDDVIGKTPSILKSGRQDNAFYAAMWHSLNSQGNWSGEIWNKKKNGDIYLEQLNVIQVLDINRKVTHYVSTFTDITQLKKYEAGLIDAKEQAECFSKLKSQFMATMSHEIRTPMTAIIGLSELALYEEMSHEARSYLQDINTASTSLLSILQDILDFSKLEVGRVVIEAIPFSLDELLNTISILFVTAANQKDLDFSIVSDKAIANMLIGDKFRLQQILTNLVGNAIKFTKQGSIKLSVSLQNIDASKIILLFSISDTGIGIAAHDQDNLFQAFTQVDGSYSREFDGTGLGLAISKELVKLMGGDIFLVSTIGLGSTFSFVLAFDTIKESIEHTSKTNQPMPVLKTTVHENKLKGATILVVEDNVMTQRIIQKHLNLFGSDVMIAQHGQEALSLLEQYHFDAVLMDIHMPVMNGIEATQLIYQQEKFATLPIIALSAGVTEQERNICISSGMVGFISKPINQNQLYTVLELWIKAKGHGTESNA